uniref:Uncharacterized protein n=1 Tax=Arundo donax TaxID=35708 RepID=A0A0A8YY83_ARUDO
MSLKNISFFLQTSNSNSIFP